MNKYIATVVAVTLLSTLALSDSAMAGEKISSTQKKKLSTLLKSIDKKARTAKPRKHEIAVPVATAGVRGAKAQKGNQFAVVWPGLTISPLLALAENLKHDASQSVETDVLLTQIQDFLKTFPEFSQEPLLEEAMSVLQ